MCIAFVIKALQCIDFAQKEVSIKLKEGINCIVFLAARCADFEVKHLVFFLCRGEKF